MIDEGDARLLRAGGHSQSEFVGRLQSKHLEKARSAALYIKPQTESKPDYQGASDWLNAAATVQPSAAWSLRNRRGGTPSALAAKRHKHAAHGVTGLRQNRDFGVAQRFSAAEIHLAFGAAGNVPTRPTVTQSAMLA